MILNQISLITCLNKMFDTMGDWQPKDEPKQKTISFKFEPT